MFTRFTPRLDAPLFASPFGRSSRRWAGISLLCTLSALSACSTPEKHGLYLQDAYIKTVIPGRSMTAGYATLINREPNELCLVNFHAQFAAAVELHVTEPVGDPDSGRVAMRQLHELCLAPGERATLRPGGMHFMIMGLDELPAQNASLTLGTRDGRGFEAAFAIRPFNQ